VAVFPLGPVAVDVLLTCADAASAQRARKETVTVREREFMFIPPGVRLSVPTDVLRTSELFRATL
jgi:hypothetical protein